MSASALKLPGGVHDAEGLSRIVGRLLSEHDGRPVVVAHLERRPSPYRTSAALDELDVELEDGRRLPLLIKETSRSGLQGEARRVKPAFVHHPLREFEVYTRVLEPARLGTCACYGAVTDEQGRCWLFLERVTAAELSQVGELATWQRAARWLAMAHATFTRTGVAERAADLHALQHGQDYWRVWLRRARRCVDDDDGDRSAALRGLARHHEAVIARLAQLPMTFIHGEFYASNVLVEPAPGRMRICPVDWEMAGVGPGLLDVAALATGWPEHDQIEVAWAYQQARREHGGPAVSREALLADLRCCQLQMALQWLGWFGKRHPPAGHTRDWLEEAMGLADRLFA